MSEYPSFLPPPLWDNSGFEPENNIMRTPMASGRARQRVSFTSVPTYVELTWRMPAVVASLFEAWAAQVAGAGWFGTKLATPLGLTDCDIRFTTTPVGPKRVSNTYWDYTARVELRERPMLAPGWVEILPDYVIMSDIFDRAMNQEWPEHQFWTYRAELDLAVNQEWAEG